MQLQTLSVIIVGNSLKTVGKQILDDSCFPLETETNIQFCKCERVSEPPRQILDVDTCCLQKQHFKMVDDIATEFPKPASNFITCQQITSIRHSVFKKMPSPPFSVCPPRPSV
jgi:hypothetical protein